MDETIFCTGCQTYVEARLTNGAEIYPSRPDLANIPIWVCDLCRSYVGCHWKTKEPLKPLGVLATRQIMDARKKIHALLDPLWQSKKIKRGKAYAYISKRLGKPYHTGEIRTIEEAREIYKIVLTLKEELA